jgi:suppressor for copper-sensitivity B
MLPVHQGKIMKFSWLSRALIILLLSFACLPAHALTGNWAQQPQGEVRLIASDKVEAGKLYAGLHFKLQQGWHIYWRSPGDAGIPPELIWKDSSNLKAATVSYPLPALHEMQGLQVYGYGDEIVLPLNVEKTDPSKGVRLDLHMSVLACSDICVPVKYDLKLDLPAGFTASQEATDLLKAWTAKVPKADNGKGLTLQSATLVSESGLNRVQIAYASPEPVTDAQAIIEIGDGSILNIVGTKILPNMVEVTLSAEAPLNAAAGKELIFTLADKTRGVAVEKKLILSGEAPPEPAGALPTLPSSPPQTDIKPVESNLEPPSLWLMIGFALIGGLILNLMPCVLPVLALKALAFASHGGGTPSGVRLSFLSTSAGIIFSFLIMAGALIGLKEAGMSVGWGVQFQNPDFLLFLMAVLLLFAANLWGFFEITLPRALADKLNWTHGHGNLMKDFLSGAFATLLATPCSAPFLGAAVSFALAGTPVQIFAIFTALGFGLAMPFLVIALFPRAATLLPKPGSWMVIMKKVLAVFLLLTAVWIAWVLSMSFMMKQDAEEANWRDFNEVEIVKLVENNNVVFVDVTAAWCLTCQANEKFVLDREDVQEALAEPDVVLMRADWTKPSEVIADYLRRHGRYGIPFNIIYGPSAKEGLVLPELLTKDVVLEGLKKAR